MFGIASVIKHISEIAAYFLVFKVIGKIGHVKVLAFGLACNVMRFLYISFITWPWLILPMEFVQGKQLSKKGIDFLQLHFQYIHQEALYFNISSCVVVLVFFAVKIDDEASHPMAVPKQKSMISFHNNRRPHFNLTTTLRVNNNNNNNTMSHLPRLGAGPHSREEDFCKVAHCDCDG